MGAGTAFNTNERPHAPCPRRHNSQLRRIAWARRTTDFGLRHRTANAFAHPTIPALDDFARTKPPRRKDARTQQHNADFRPHQRILARLQNRFPPRIKML
jgi:hypothetical protein